MFTFLGTHQEGEICKSHGTLPELKAFIDSKANNDMKMYSGEWQRRKNWALSEVGVNVILPQPSVAPLEIAVCHIQWVHTIAGQSII